MSILKQLKDSTFSEHKRLESLYPFNRLVRTDLTQQDYFCALKILYALHASLDQNTSKIPEIQRLQTGIRSTKDALLADLNDEKAAIFRTQRADQPKVDIELNCDGQLSGALYVLEGSKLGARLILRELEKRPDQHTLPLRYSKAAAKDRCWKTFGDTLERLAIENKIEIDACISGAQATFAALILCAEQLSGHLEA